ncbi:hypothetical protein LTSESEN_5415 [Salmonella enterica subsp. enterica serovar Senftenberg str. A4-543]|uniref:Uncharacterized protein n=1 Tax=Salmonella enterica subsp. enterica serovar Senftenberg str. A4-543 TaxID=913082 RepID=G5R6T7_SALSE|nr:hypothetical protein LTSESEN_5415 [Salmonella enterica subsp. enterica serovar Senftenberg str. A4-543]
MVKNLNSGKTGGAGIEPASGITSALPVDPPAFAKIGWHDKLR